jgi:hypothetical protein
MSDSERSRRIDQKRLDLMTHCRNLGDDYLGKALVEEIGRKSGYPHISIDTDARRKFDLDCLRSAADCMQLACDVKDPRLQRHFLERARQLTAATEIASPATAV